MWRGGVLGPKTYIYISELYKVKKTYPKTLGDGDGYTLKNKINQIKKDAAI